MCPKVLFINLILRFRPSGLQSARRATVSGRGVSALGMRAPAGNSLLVSQFCNSVISRQFVVN